MFLLPSPRFSPCEQCGASVPWGDPATHECDPEQRLDFQLLQLRDEIATFDDALESWLDSPRGRFELYYAQRTRAA
jgi:hypothetical protein